MRIMLDTNVLFSALVFPNGSCAKFLSSAVSKHEIVICSYVIDELKKVISKKFPSLLEAVDRFLNAFCFEYVYTSETIERNLFSIRDPKDYPILYTAVIENVDVIVSGDADFKDTNVTRPEILTPTEFMEKY